MKLNLVGMPGSIDRGERIRLILLPQSVNWETAELKRTLRILSSFEQYYSKLSICKHGCGYYLIAKNGDGLICGAYLIEEDKRTYAYFRANLGKENKRGIDKTR